MLTNKIWRFLSIPAVKTGYVALMVLGLPCEHMSRCMFAINWFRIFFHLQGNLGQAEVIGREALRLLPKDHTIMFSLANVLGKLQKYKVSQLSMNILTHNVAFFLFMLIISNSLVISAVKFIVRSGFFYFVLRSQRVSSCVLFRSTQMLPVAMAI